MEAVFRALSDPHRRRLLDLLRERDGRTLAELDRHLPMTRYGTMKHLRVLERAGLVITQKVGREKRHFLNTGPIRLVHDGWFWPYAGRWRRTDDAALRPGEDEGMRSPMHVYEVYIRTTPERLWRAITSPEDTSRYYDGTRVESTWTAGAPLTYRGADGRIAAAGEVIEARRAEHLEHTFDARWDEQVAKDAPHRVTWDIEPMGGTCRLRVTHSGFTGDTATLRSIGRGLAFILSGLKTLLETGEPLVVSMG